MNFLVIPENKFLPPFKQFFATVFYDFPFFILPAMDLLLLQGTVWNLTNTVNVNCLGVLRASVVESIFIPAESWPYDAGR